MKTNLVVGEDGFDWKVVSNVHWLWQSHDGIFTSSLSMPQVSYSTTIIGPTTLNILHSSKMGETNIDTHPRFKNVPQTCEISRCHRRGWTLRYHAWRPRLKCLNVGDAYRLTFHRYRPGKRAWHIDVGLVSIGSKCRISQGAERYVRRAGKGWFRRKGCFFLFLLENNFWYFE